MHGLCCLSAMAAVHLILLSASGAAPHRFLSVTGARWALPGLGELLHPPMAEGQAWLGTETVLALGVMHL